jgi:hypothetical protein
LGRSKIRKQEELRWDFTYNSSKSCGFLTSILGARGEEQAGRLSREGLLRPKTTSSVQEGLHLRRHHTEPCRHLTIKNPSRKSKVRNISIKGGARWYLRLRTPKTIASASKRLGGAMMGTSGLGGAWIILRTSGLNVSGTCHSFVSTPSIASAPSLMP